MGYDIRGRYDKDPISELQWKILIHVCKNKGANYKSICSETGRNRTTIIQSIEPMIKRRCIDKIRVDPVLEKSKLIFTPTYKGKSYAEAWGLGAEQIFSNETDPNILGYLQILKQIPNVSQRKIMLQELASNLLNLLIINAKGDISTDDKILSLKDAFRDGLLGLIQNDNYDANELLNDSTTEWINKLFSPGEIMEMNEMLLKIKGNIDSTIRKL